MAWPTNFASVVCTGVANASNPLCQSANVKSFLYMSNILLIKMYVQHECFGLNVTTPGVVVIWSYVSTHQAYVSTHQAYVSTHQAAVSTHQAGVSTHQADVSTHQAYVSTHQADIPDCGQVHLINREQKFKLYTVDCIVVTDDSSHLTRYAYPSLPRRMRVDVAVSWPFDVDAP